jgi:malate dehydrogenase (oxaloacetate-decarboxylating)
LPIVYTPVVGTACQRFSHIYRRPHGIFLSYHDRAHIDRCLAGMDRQVDVIVVTDGERILGLGDQGLGGMGIPIGKLSLYTAFGGVDPTRTLPVLLDAGTNNPDLLNDPLYMGWRHERVTGSDYDEFVATFVDAVKRHHPTALLQWEDFAQHHATTLLTRYRDELPSFNDDIQGTAAVALAALLAGARAAGSRLEQQRVCIVGAGSAGSGIASQIVAAMIAGGMPESEALTRVHLVDRRGLLHDRLDDLRPYQQRFAQPFDSVAAWAADGQVPLPTALEAMGSNALIGVSGVGGLFTEQLIRQMAANVEHPIIFPLSNPTSHAEARPEDLIRWTDGRALVATGSPFPDVSFNGRQHAIAQANNVYVFPGLGLGAIAVGARRVSDAMMMAAAHAVGRLSPCSSDDPCLGLLPPLQDARHLSREIAIAVAKQAVADGSTEPMDDDQIEAQVDAAIWEPRYPHLVAG